MRKVSLFGIAMIVIAAGIALAAGNYALARRAERRNPPRGKFIQIDRVRLHYVDRGTGPAVILLHGNGMMARDFELSGLIDLLAKGHRVIAFDRPGFGHSERPRNRIWTAEAQAILLWRALSEIFLRQPRGFRDHHTCFGCGGPDLPRADGQFKRKAALEATRDRCRREHGAKETRGHDSAQKG